MEDKNDPNYQKYLEIEKKLTQNESNTSCKFNGNLLLTNSLTKKEIFKPINQNKISMYACSPTVYDSPHVGNARSLVVFDVLFRVLKFIYGTKVNYVRNITDVDDKIIEASKQKNKNIKEHQ